MSADSAQFEAPPTVAAEIFGERLDKAIAYHRSLATTGSERGFMGPREVPRLWDRHILNCAVIGEAFADSISIADIGSGAGLPGIPLALARPDLQIHLVEPLLKRSTYLNEIIDELALDNVTVVRGRAEDREVQELGPVDVVTSRAVAPLGRLVGWSMPLAKVGGDVVAMKGASVPEELARDRKEITKAGGGEAEIFTVGDGLIAEPATLIRIPRIK